MDKQVLIATKVVGKKQFKLFKNYAKCKEILKLCAYQQKFHYYLKNYGSYVENGWEIKKVDLIDLISDQVNSEFCFFLLNKKEFCKFTKK